jgi:hypothetical protein
MHVHLFIILNFVVPFIKFLLQLYKFVIWLVPHVIVTPIKYCIFESEHEKIHYILINSFTKLVLMVALKTLT